ncbi:MAG: glycosyltransferase family 9 protein [Bacteroidales bacterium]
MKTDRILISRTDSIGDVILTLPMAGVLKKVYPESTILFLGRAYTRDIVETSRFVDRFLDWDEINAMDRCTKVETFNSFKADVIIHVFPRRMIAMLARQAKIPIRIGTTGRAYHYLLCNRLVPLSRKRSTLHEAQLNLKLIQSLVAHENYILDEIPAYYGFSKVDPLHEQYAILLSKQKFNLIIHPKSKGSAREWGLDNFKKLIEILPRDRFNIFITGTEADGKKIKSALVDQFSHINDLTGKLSLKELISFINSADGLLAASTGPLHIAAALGKFALGLYPPIKPMHPGRWAPIGKRAHYLVMDKDCSDCRKKTECQCMKTISPHQVKDKLISFIDG